MTTPVFAFVIGVSNYHTNRFDPLPAAQSDARNFSRLLIQQGFPETKIFLLNTPYVTSEQFFKSLEKIASLTKPFQLVFYFCGHGFRTEGKTPQSYLIFSESELDQNRCLQGVPLETLIQTFTSMKTTAISLFIDACHLRLNSIINPKLIEEIQGKKESNKTLFCLFSSGIFPSYENVQHQYGYFTEALIKALRHLVHKDFSPKVLFRLIQKDLKKNGLPQPEMYNIGMHTLDLFPKTPKKRSNEKEIKKAMGAIYSSGIVIDEALLGKVFDIEIEIFKELENLGLIFYEKGAWHPYGYLTEIVEKENIKLEPELTKSYWFQQFNELPDNFEAALHFVMSIQCFGYEYIYDDVLQLAF